MMPFCLHSCGKTNKDHQSAEGRKRPLLQVKYMRTYCYGEGCPWLTNTQVFIHLNFNALTLGKKPEQ